MSTRVRSNALAREMRSDNDASRWAVAATVAMAGEEAALHEFAEHLRAGDGLLAQLGDASPNQHVVSARRGKAVVVFGRGAFDLGRQRDQRVQQFLVRRRNLFSSRAVMSDSAASACDGIGPSASATGRPRKAISR